MIHNIQDISQVFFAAFLSFCSIDILFVDLWVTLKWMALSREAVKWKIISRFYLFIEWKCKFSTDIFMLLVFFYEMEAAHNDKNLTFFPPRFGFQRRLCLLFWLFRGLKDYVCNTFNPTWHSKSFYCNYCCLNWLYLPTTKKEV